MSAPGRNDDIECDKIIPPEMTNAERAQRSLLGRLACPESSGSVEILPLEVAGAAIKRGIILSRVLDKPVGKIEDFQIDFVRPDSEAASAFSRGEISAGQAPTVVADIQEWALTSFESADIQYSGRTVKLENYDMIVVENAGSSIRFAGSGPIEILLYAHPWSGFADVRFSGRVETIDLFAPHSVIPRTHRIDVGKNRQTVEIVVTGRSNELSGGQQCLFGGFRALTGRRIPLRYRKQAKVRGAAFTAAFYELLAAVPESGLVLDIGGGNRQFDDARYINADYANYPEPDLIGDATKLPLRDACVDAVYSTGVFEHINDPFKAGAEVARVLKPGGKAVIGWAFMQPIHSEGQHFYNATPWGMERAFAALKVKRMWYDTSFSYLVRWGASVSGLGDKVSAEEIETVCATLARWDALIPETHKPYMANGVWCEFEKV